MIALIQRVSEASVTIDKQCSAEIGVGLLVLLGVRQADTQNNASTLAKKLLRYRVFPDENGKMNLDIHQANADILIVPQFTLAADTSSGRRPGFSTAAPPDIAKALFDEFCRLVRGELGAVQTGTFGADMKVALINDGPVTFWLEA